LCGPLPGGLKTRTYGDERFSLMPNESRAHEQRFLLPGMGEG